MNCEVLSNLLFIGPSNVAATHQSPHNPTDAKDTASRHLSQLSRWTIDESKALLVELQKLVAQAGELASA
jgi:hypothetical protein